MKNKLNIRLIVCLIIGFIGLGNITVFADAPYRTWTAGPNGRLVGTQTAYEPSEVLTYPVADPEDIFIQDKTGTIYLADTGNSRILVVKNNEQTQVVGEGILRSPSGIYVDDTNKIYVADYGMKKVFIFDKDGRLMKEIGKPTEPIYGKRSDFVPKKIAVDKRNNIYVISEGSINGVIQLNKEGQFAGFVGANKTDLSFKMLVQRLIFTDNQKGQLFKVTPPSPTSIAIDEQGLVHTVTSAVKSEGVKKLNITGVNILSSDMRASEKLVDMDVDKDGNIYALDSDGLIYVYDSFGNILFIFGGKDGQYERMGMFKNPVAIDVSDKGKLYVVDKERRVVNSYNTTEFADKVLEGVNLYKQGLYVESQGIWKEILKMNSSFILSYKALANSYFKQDKYSEALEGFELAEDKKGYSDAYWQIRNFWFQENATKILLGIFILLIIKFVLGKADKRFGIFKGLRAAIKRFKEIKLVAELRFAFRFFKHPIDSFYEIKYSERASVLSATVLYVWFLMLQILGLFITGFTFSKGNPYYINLSSIITSTYAPLALWVVSNYLVSTISDGEGKFKHVYISTIYALVPYLVIAFPVMIISNILTLNEAFVFSFSLFIAKAWSAILLVAMVKEIHDYTFKETVKNILVTIFGMILIVLVLFILFILFNQEVDFIKSIIQELRIRV